MLLSIRNYLVANNWPAFGVDIATVSAALVIMLLFAVLIYWFATRTFVPLLEKAMHRTTFKWDDYFVKHNFFKDLAMLLPLVFFYTTADVFLVDYATSAEIMRRLSMTLFIFVALRCFNDLLLITADIYNSTRKTADKPITAYLNAIKLFLYLFCGIFIVATLTDKSPWGIFSVMGGLTAVLLLIFKDSILGFVASLQLFSHNMIRVGDWIEMQKYGADGDVVEVNIHTVKVQNWDKTITTIPTYALVSNSFKNWRGMNESGGRRIKRSIFIDMQSICFCTEAMLEKFSSFEFIADYIKEKQTEISNYNQQHEVDTSTTVNGRRQTNIGILRAYIKAYLHNHSKIHQNMTLLVRHLQPTDKGLPIEIYVFSNDQVWVNYEDIQADIFDHILAVIPEFGLRVYQAPAGYDFQRLSSFGDSN